MYFVFKKLICCLVAKLANCGRLKKQARLFISELQITLITINCRGATDCSMKSCTVRASVVRYNK